MEFYVIGTLASIGYLLTKNNKTKEKKDLKILKNETPSSQNVYNSTHVDEVDNIVRKKSKKNFNKSLKYKQTGVIPINLKEIGDNNNNTTHSSLAGVEIPIEDFKHNNMVPFFGGSIKQNTDTFRTHSTLERYTGVSDLFQNKKEIAPLNDTNVSIGNVYGMESTVDFEQERLINSQFQNNVLPFKQERVGVGLNRGTNSVPTGGFQQDTREFEYDKGVDELRVATAPKISYEGRTIDGQKSIARGQVGDLAKNRVETYSEQNKENLFTTVGAVTKETNRSCQIVKDTVRKDTSVEYTGTAYNNNQQEVRSGVKCTNRQQLDGYGIRNEDKTDIGNSSDDFGKANILVYTNERDITTVKGYEGNLTTLVKSIVAPVQDILKLTKNEFTINSERPLGNMTIQYPNKQTLYDPNDICRTTIKETNIHDEITFNMTGEWNKGVVYDPDEIAKITLRQTLENETNDTNLTLKVPKSTVYDPNDIAKTTLTELTEDGTRTGHINRNTIQEGGSYKTNIYDAPNTNRQLDSQREYKGGIKYANGEKVDNFDVANTNRQFTSDKDYTGIANSKNKKDTSHESMYNMLVNDVKENLLNERVPTTQGPKQISNSSMINTQPLKLQIQSENDNIYGNYQGGIAPKGAHSIVDDIEHDLQFTQNKPTYNNYDNDRLDVSLLDAYKQNPYTKSLTSVA